MVSHIAGIVTQNRTEQQEWLRHSHDETDEILVLHIDDDRQFCELVETYLQKLDAGITVITETDPESGLERLATGHVDCIISDYQMPGLDGIDLLKTVREDYPNLPFILFTGKGSEEVASEAINAGVTTYFQKDGTEMYELLANEVHNAVSRRRSQRLAQVTKDRLFGMYEQADGFYFLDEDWTIRYWNQKMANRTGHSAVEVLGQSYWDIFPEAQGLKTEEHFREAMETGEPVRFEAESDTGEY
jgi:CheY-like chemotaxis protein